MAEAKKKGEKTHMARVHGLIYEKNYQLKQDDPARKFKGRGVLLGQGPEHGSGAVPGFGQFTSNV